MIALPTTDPAPQTTCQTSAGKPASSSSSHAEQRGQRGLRVGLVHDGVAGEQGGQPVGQRHRERVVPGRDDPDDALGDAVDLDPGEHGARRRRGGSAPGAAGPCGRSSGRSARRARSRRTRACGPCRTPSTRSMISSWRSSTRSCRRSISARCSAAAVRPVLLRPAGPLEGGVDVADVRVGDAAIGWPVNGAVVVTESPQVARMRPVSLRTGPGRARTWRTGRARGRAAPRRGRGVRTAGRSYTEGRDGPPAGHPRHSGGATGRRPRRAGTP